MSIKQFCRSKNICFTFFFFKDPIKGLQEVKKILKINGYLVQIEHGLSRFWLINWFMKLVDPIVYKFGGLHITRNHLQNLRVGGFRVIHQRPLDPLGIILIIISKPI